MPLVAPLSPPSSREGLHVSLLERARACSLAEGLKWGPAVCASLQRRWAPPLSPEPSLPALGSDPQSHPVRRGSSSCEQGCTLGVSWLEAGQAEARAGPSPGFARGWSWGRVLGTRATPDVPSSGSGATRGSGWFAALFALKPRGGVPFPLPEASVLHFVDLRSVALFFSPKARPRRVTPIHSPQGWRP